MRSPHWLVIGQSGRVELSPLVRRRTRVKRFLLVTGLVLIAAACSASHSRASSTTSTRPATARNTTATGTPTCRGCGRPAVTPAVLCAQAFGKTVVSSAGTTVGVVRQSGIGLEGGVFKAAFPSAHDADRAAWCMLSTSSGCYDESAVASNGERQHIAAPGCGWSNGPPRAGPAIWTD
jgi:hypothetical protein